MSRKRDDRARRRYTSAEPCNKRRMLSEKFEDIKEADHVKQEELCRGAIRAEKWRCLRQCPTFRRKNLLYVDGATRFEKTIISSRGLTRSEGKRWEPPRMCMKQSVQPDMRSAGEKRRRLESMVHILSDPHFRKKLMKFATKQGSSTGVKALNEIFNQFQALKASSTVNGKLEDCVIKPETEESDENQSQTSSEQRPCVSLKFTDIRGSLFSGDRIAEIEVFFVERLPNDHFSAPRRVPSALMQMPVNKKTKRFIDIPWKCMQSMHKPHLFLSVRISNDRSDVKIDGRSFRKTPSRLAVSGPPVSTSKSDTSNDHHWEFAYFGSKAVDLTVDGETEVSITLVEKELVSDDESSDTDFIVNLEALARKNHTNPFVRLSVGSCDDEESSNGSDTTNSTHCSQTKHRPTIETMVDAYLKRMIFDNDGDYIGDTREIELYYGEDQTLDEQCVLYKWLAKIQTAPSFSAYYRFDFESSNSSQLFEEDAGHCIFCSFKCSMVVTLLFHLNTCHSHFIFTVVPPTLKGKWASYSGVSADQLIVIAVDVNSRADDTMEVCTSRVPCRKAGSAAYFFITRFQSAQLRSRLRMDLTMFFRNMNTREVVRTGTEVQKKFVNTNTGSKITSSISPVSKPHDFPPLSYEALLRNMIETISDYIDIDDKSKQYMKYWNQLMLYIGKPNVAIAGTYMTHRLFLEVFGEYLKESQGMDRFIAQVTDLASKGALSGDDSYDLIARIGRRDYHPLKDSENPLRLALMNYARHRYRKSLSNNNINSRRAQFQQCPPTPAVLPTQQTVAIDPDDLSESEQFKLIIQLWRSGTALSPTDPRRCYMQNAMKSFGPSSAKIFKTMSIS